MKICKLTGLGAIAVATTLCHCGGDNAGAGVNDPDTGGQSGNGPVLGGGVDAGAPGTTCDPDSPGCTSKGQSDAGTPSTADGGGPPKGGAQNDGGPLSYDAGTVEDAAAPPPPPPDPGPPPAADTCTGAFVILGAPFAGVLSLSDDGSGTLSGYLNYESSGYGNEAISGMCTTSGGSGTLQFTRETTGEHYVANLTFDGTGHILSINGTFGSSSWCWTGSPASGAIPPWATCQGIACSGNLAITAAGYSGVLTMTAGGSGTFSGTVNYENNGNETVTGYCCESQGVAFVDIFRGTERYFGTASLTGGTITSISGTLSDPGTCTIYNFSASSQ